MNNMSSTICMTGGGGGGEGRSEGGGLLPSEMNLRVAPAPSPIGFEATLSVAMELENKLKAETTDGFESHRCDEDSKCVLTDEERQTRDVVKPNSMNGKSEDRECLSPSARPGKDTTDLSNGKADLNRSLNVEEDLMEEDEEDEDDVEDDGSVGHSSVSDGNISYTEISPRMHSAEHSKDDDDLDEDLDPLQKLQNALGRNGLHGSLGNNTQLLNGRPGSSDDNYDGAGSEGSTNHSYHHSSHLRDECGTLDNEDELYQCHLCSFTTTSKFQLNPHISSHYNHKCNHCDYTSRTEGRLKRHMKDFHSELSFEAFSPGEVVVKSGNDSNGGNSQGKAKTYRCKQCSYVATVKADFWDHSKTHIKAEKLLTCPTCPFVTEYKHHLEYHLRNHFGSKPFKCPKCNYSCVNKSMLNSHMKSHSNIYQYRCANCTYATKYCHSLKLHLRKYAHTPSTVLNPDGTPNPIPVIDVYGTRRGPRPKKSTQEDVFGNSGGNSSNGSLPFTPLQVPANGALSQPGVLPFFYPGSSGPLSNGFHSNSEGLLHQGNLSKSPLTMMNSIGNGGGTGGGGSNGTVKDEEPEENRKNHSQGNGTMKCNLCEFSTDLKERFTKHMLLHAAAENQDLCNLYGINSDNLMQDPNQQQHQQQQMNVATMAAVAAVLGLPSPSHVHRSDQYRQHHALTSSLPGQDNQDHGQNGDHHNIPVHTSQGNKKPSKHLEDNRRTPPSLTPNPLDHLRAFSEQVTVKPFMMRELSTGSLYPSNPIQVIGNNVVSGGNGDNFVVIGGGGTNATGGAETVRNAEIAVEKLSHNGTYVKVSPPSHHIHISKASKDGAIPTEGSPHSSEIVSNLRPLDLSSAKGIPSRHRVFHPMQQQQHLQYQLTQPIQRYHITQQSHHLLHQQQQQQHHQYHPQVSTSEVLEISTDGSLTQGHSPVEACSPTQPKNRRKGKAFKLDRICMKLQKERESPGHPSSVQTDDSMEDGEVSKMSDTGEETYIKTENDINDFSVESSEEQVTKKNANDIENGLTVNSSNRKSLSTELNAPSDCKSQEVQASSSPGGTNTKDENDGWKEAYECQYCDMAFKDCIMYTVHMGYHGYKDPFKCNMCGQQTKDKVAFFLHIARTAHL